MNDAGTDASPPAAALHLGYRTETLTYTPRGREVPRTLPVALWYPATGTSDTTALYKVFPRDDVFVDAPSALTDPAPVLLFSHGRRGFGEYAYFLCEYFARRGWLVAAVDHVGDRLADGETPVDIYSLRPQDISALIDHITSLSDDHPLAGKASDQIVLAGHSFGGYTTFVVAGAGYDIDTLRATCAADADQRFCANLAIDDALFAEGLGDPRIKVAIPMAPGDADMFSAGLDQITIPVMLMTADRDRNVPMATNAVPIWAGLNRPEHRHVQFHNGGHFTFTNVCPFAGPLGEDNGCDDSFIPLDKAQPIINAYAFAFARRHLFNDESEAALLDGERTLDDTVELLRK